ncbi:hypothetical protein [Lysinibacillus sphaericus]|uniref:hypothetical protein n=1 Tax=Lysinibacillus sphaericus TaxID=1421 RepID=UPI0034A053B7
MRIRYKNHEFEIKYVLNPYFKNETLESGLIIKEVLLFLFPTYTYKQRAYFVMFIFLAFPYAF